MPRGISLRSGKSALPSMNVCGEVGGTVGMAELDSWNGAPDVWSSVRVAGQGQGGVLDRVRKGRTPTSAPWAGSVVGGRKLGLMWRRKRKQGGC